MEIKISSIFKKYSELQEKEVVNSQMGILDIMLKGKVSFLKTVLMNCEQKIEIGEKDWNIARAILNES